MTSSVFVLTTLAVLAQQGASPIVGAEAEVPPASLATLPVAPGGLTADAVAARAASTSFEVQARLHERQAAESAVAEAKAAFLPQLSGLARYTRLSEITLPSLGNVIAAPGVPAGPVPPGTQLQAVPFTFPVILNQYAAQATLAIPLSDYLLRIPQVYSSAQERQRGAALAERAARAASATQGRMLFYGWAKANWQVLVAQQSLKQAQGHLSDIEKSAAVGRASRADVLRLKSQVASAELFVTRSQALAQVYNQQLRVALHDGGNGPYQLGEDVQSEVDVVESEGLPVENFEPLYKEALTYRLEPKAIDAATRGLREQAKAVRSRRLPRLDAVANAVYANPNPRFIPQQDRWNGTWDATLQLSWTPTDIFGAGSQTTALLRQAEASEAQHASLEDSVKVEVAQAVSNVRQAMAAQKTAAEGLAAAQESYRVRKLLEESGRATTIEVVDAETDLLRARLDVVSARLDARAARAQLDHALGRDVR